MRLLPRFSLRFAWIALTILLIAVGIGVNYWRAYQAHERVASKLEALGYNIEEEDDTLFGYVIAKRITGVQGYFSYENNDGTAALRELPNKPALRRLSCSVNYPDPLLPKGSKLAPVDHELLRVIGQMTALEILDLSIPNSAPGHLQELAPLQQLRSLRLDGNTLPTGELRPLLDRLPKLERLSIREYHGVVTTHADEVLQATLPNLRELHLELMKQRIARLDLTKKGIGRFPNLEYLMLEHIGIEQVAVEAGAMPRLKILDIFGAGKKATVDWAELPCAAPQLSGLALHNAQLTPAVVTMLSQYPTLRHVYVAGLNGPEMFILHHDRLKMQPQPLDPKSNSNKSLHDLLKLGERLQFPMINHELWYSIPADKLRISSWPSWDIQQPRPQPPGGGFF